MGLMEILFPKKNEKPQAAYFQTLNGYTPSFTSHSGGMYEMALTQAAIHSFASNCSKLNPVVEGAAGQAYASVLSTRPNPWMTTQQFLYRLATMLECEHNAYVVPLYSDTARTVISGFYPIRPTATEPIEVDGELFYRFSFANGLRTSIEFSRVGHLRDRYYRNDLFGEGAQALTPTIELLNTQSQGIVNGIKQSAAIRFIGMLAQTLKPEDIEAEKKRFVADNLSAGNNGGAVFVDRKYSDLKPIDSKPWVIDPKQSEQIDRNVYSYFGTNENILRNSYSEDEWNAYYEGKIEPFALQLSQVMTCMLFSQTQLAHGNKITFEADRLQYLSSKTKIQLVTQLFDRGLMDYPRACMIFNMAESGNDRFIRGEYINVNDIASKGNNAKSDMALTGPQITSMMDIVCAVAAGTLPPGSGAEILKLAFGVDDTAAKTILAGAGTELVLTPNDPAPADEGATKFEMGGDKDAGLS